MSTDECSAHLQRVKIEATPCEEEVACTRGRRGGAATLRMKFLPFVADARLEAYAIVAAKKAW